MARYRKIEVATWTDERVCRLSAPQPNGQTLWHYLITGPRTTTFPGLVVAREAVMADDLGWPIEAFREAFREVCREGLAKADWKAGVVVLSKALIDSTGEPRETARPQSPNVIRGWASSWNEVPECDLKREYLQHLGAFAKALGEAFAQAFGEGFRKALVKASTHPSPIQDSGFRTQDQESGSRSPLPPSGGTQASFDESSDSRQSKPTAKRTGRPKKQRPTDPTPYELAVARVVLDKLSSRNGVAYTGSPEHVRLITQLLRQGLTEVDLRKVITYCAEHLGWWDKPEMRAYLRPETLFGPKTHAKYLDPARAWFASTPVEPIVPREELAS